MKILFFILIFGSVIINKSVAQCWKFLSSGNDFSSAIAQDGTLWSWGYGTQYGNIGNGTTFTNYTTPIQISASTNWKTVYNGQAHSYALTNNGEIWAWGANNIGQLGNGTITDSYVPIKMGTNSDWQSIASGGGFGFNSGFAIKTNGTLWAWGNNVLGQLGLGNSTSYYNSPTKVGTSSDWLKISLSGNHTLAIKQDGSLWAWGTNYSGELGNGTYINTNVPIQIGSALNWKEVSAGLDFSMAIKQDGSLWAWGLNDFGNLGDGTTTQKNIPTQIGTSMDWDIIVAGNNHTAAIKQNGTLWSWGNNSSYQLGNGTTTASTIPIQIGTANDWKNITLGLESSIALKQTNTRWGWGYNNVGQLGLGFLGDGTPANQFYMPTPYQSGTCSILPIKLLSFTAKNNNSHNLLEWTTTQEINNTYFEIERSGDGLNFIKIGKINGAGNTNDNTIYQFKDEIPLVDKNYYRLKQVNAKGSFEYSKIIVLTNNISNTITIFPNPSTNYLKINGVLKAITYSISNSLGQIIQKGIYTAEQQINVTKLQRGLYFLKIENTVHKLLLK